MRAVAFSPDGKTLISGGTDGTIRLWEVPRPLPVAGPVAGKEVQVLQTKEPVSAIALSADGRLLASGGGARTISVWNFGTRRVVQQLETSESVDALAFAPDGKTLASNGCRSVCLWDLNTSTARMTMVDDLVGSLAFTPDGKAVAVGSYRSRVRLLDAATGQDVCRIAGHRVESRIPRIYSVAVAFTPDGKTLASGGGDGAIRLWDPATGKEKARLEGPGHPLTAIAFSPDGKRVVTGGADHTVRIWDVASGKQLNVGNDPGGAVSTLSVGAAARRWPRCIRPVGSNCGTPWNTSRSSCPRRWQIRKVEFGPRHTRRTERRWPWAQLSAHCG